MLGAEPKSRVMEVNEQELRERYESLETNELVYIFITSDLTAVEYSILIEALSGRGINVDDLKAKVGAETSTQTTIILKPVSTPLPPFWIGYMIVVVFFVYNFVELRTGAYSKDKILEGLIIMLLTGFVNWLFCVYRVHLILAEATNNQYPITPGKGAAFNLIPFFNLFWLFKWTNEIASFLNSQAEKKIMSKGMTGFFLLVGFFVLKVDISIGLLIWFSVIWYISKKIRHVVQFKGRS